MGYERDLATDSTMVTTILTVGQREYLLDNAAVFALPDSLLENVRLLLREGTQWGGYALATVIRGDDAMSLYDEAGLGTEAMARKDGRGEIAGRWDEGGIGRLTNWCRERDGDVWTEEFLGVIIILDHRGHEDGDKLDQPTNTSHKVLYVNPDLGAGVVMPGPYVMQIETGKIFPVRRLFPDVNNCFVRGSVPSSQTLVGEKGTAVFRWLESTEHIPVPSRLYHPPPTADKPLNGLRFGVKDVIDIAGLQTGCGSADYRKFHAPRTQTAACIQRLVDAGAVMVGKMRCCQWCDGQDPMERYEEPTPTNPRGDLFQKPSGSSSGSAAGVASYPWLDFAIGTDTGGSIRHPAAVNGVYGVRPSLGSVDSAGLVCSEWTDTTGVFARSAKVARDAMAILTDPQWRRQHSDLIGAERDGVMRYQVIYAVNAPGDETNKFFSPGGSGAEATSPAAQHLETFVSALETHLNCKRQEVCISELWRDTHPPEALCADLIEATEKIYQNVVYHDLAKHAVEPFVREFAAKNGARRPYIEPSTRARLEYGASLPEEKYRRSIGALRVFGGWVNQTLLPGPILSPNQAGRPSEDEGSITIPLLVYPVSRGTPNYRSDFKPRAPGDNIFWTGFSTFGISYCSGCPDFTLPVGEVDFYSKVTDTVEKLPIAIALLGPKGADGLMLDLIAELEGNGLLRAVGCGKSLW